jgi:hypothetical protein
MDNQYFVKNLKNSLSVTITNKIFYKNNNCTVSYIFERNAGKYSFTLKRDLDMESFLNSYESKKFDNMHGDDQRNYLLNFKFKHTWSPVTGFKCVYDDRTQQGWLLHLIHDKTRQSSLPQWSVFPENIMTEIRSDLINYFQVRLQ